MLQPKKAKHRKHFRLRSALKGKSARGNSVSFGQFGIKATTEGEITSRQIEAARRAMTRHLKRLGKVWIRVFPDKVVTRKGAEVPMGSGKGAPEYHAVDILPGRVLFEIGGVEEDLARKALSLASYKLPVKTKFVTQDRGIA
jgi:large subunit ribosomal protein L16